MFRPFITGAETQLAAPPVNTPVVEEHEPDYRFTLANERTFLAWIRTALALLAGSVAIVQLVPAFALPDARKVLGGLLALASVGLVLYSATRWRSVQRAMRLDAPLPPASIVWPFAAGLMFIGFLVLVLVVAFGIGHG
jgi:putative membrane protein